VNRFPIPLVLFLALATGITAQQDERSLLRQGMKLQNEGQTEAAILVYERLRDRNARNISVVYRLASAYQKVGRYDDAIALLGDRLRRAPGDITALNRLSDVYFAAGMPSEADEQVERILQISPNQGTYISVGKRYEGRNQDERATEVYLRGRRVLKDPELFSRELGQIYERAENYPAAVRAYSTLAQQKPQYVSLVESRLRTIAAEAPDLPPLFDLLLESVKGGYRDSRTTRLFVTFAIEAGLTTEALRELLTLPARAPVEGSLLRIGREALEHGEAGDAIRAFESLASRTRNRTITSQARAGLAQALERNDRLQEALETYRLVLSSPGNNHVREESAYRLGRLLHRVGRADSAVKALEATIEEGHRSKWRAQAIDLLGDIQLAEGRYEEAARSYGRNASENRGKEDGTAAIYKLARLETVRKDYAAAQKALNRILRAGLASLVYNDALELSTIVEIGLAEDPAGLDAYADGLRLEAEENWSAAARTVLVAGESTPDGVLTDRLFRRGIEIRMDTADWPEAERSLRQMTGMDTPLRSWAHFVLGLCLERQNRVDEAITIYEGLLVEYPQTLEADRARERLTDLKTASSHRVGEAG